MTWATSWPTVFFAQLEDRAGNFSFPFAARRSTK
jgi:hypothetical protein